jgi:hypothetical protein
MPHEADGHSVAAQAAGGAPGGAPPRLHVPRSTSFLSGRLYLNRSIRQTGEPEAACRSGM